jgi:hypothetical protein
MLSGKKDGIDKKATAATHGPRIVTPCHTANYKSWRVSLQRKEDAATVLAMLQYIPSDIAAST